MGTRRPLEIRASSETSVIRSITAWPKQHRTACFRIVKCRDLVRKNHPASAILPQQFQRLFNEQDVKIVAAAGGLIPLSEVPFYLFTLFLKQRSSIDVRADFR